MNKLILKPTEKVSVEKVKHIIINEEDIAESFLDGIDDSKLRSSTGQKVSIRNDNSFENKALFLVANYDYILGKDSSGATILVPLKKK